MLADDIKVIDFLKSQGFYPDDNGAWSRIKNVLVDGQKKADNNAMAKLLNELDALVWKNIHGLGAISELGSICERWRNIRQ